MWRIVKFIPLIVIALPITAFAEDKKERAPKTLVEEAVHLMENSGENGWVSAEVTVSKKDGEEKAKGKLMMVFKTDKGKATGHVSLRIDFDTVQIASGPGHHFELVEKDGKRYFRISDVKGKSGELKPDTDTTRTLEYSIDGDQLTLKGGVIRKMWVGFDVDFAKGITFKEAGR